MKQRQTIIEEYFQKQNKLRSLLKTYKKTIMILMLLLSQYQEDMINAINFVLTFKKDQQIYNIYQQKMSKQNLLIFTNALQEQHNILADKKCNLIDKKKMKAQRKCRIGKNYLNQSQRNLILKYQNFGYSNSIISGLFKISKSQVQKSQMLLFSNKLKIGFKLSNDEKIWIIRQGSKESNPILFSLNQFYNQFKNKFEKFKILSKIIQKCFAFSQYSKKSSHA